MSNLPDLSGNDLLNAVVEYVFQHEITPLGLSEVLQTVYFISNFEFEFYNGGIYQFFSNSSGQFSQETIASFKRIGAGRIALLIAEGFAAFANEAILTSAFSELDHQLHEDYPTNSEGNVGDQLINYLQANRAALSLN